MLMATNVVKNILDYSNIIRCNVWVSVCGGVLTIVWVSVCGGVLTIVWAFWYLYLLCFVLF